MIVLKMTWIHAYCEAATTCFALDPPKGEKVGPYYGRTTNDYGQSDVRNSHEFVMSHETALWIGIPLRVVARARSRMICVPYK